MLKIELDEVKKWRNKSEYREIPRARCGNIEVIGHGKIVSRLCAELAELYDEAEMVEVWRGDVPCFKPRKLGFWAKSD